MRNLRRYPRRTNFVPIDWSNAGPENRTFSAVLVSCPLRSLTSARSCSWGFFLAGSLAAPKEAVVNSQLQVQGTRSCGGTSQDDGELRAPCIRHTSNGAFGASPPRAAAKDRIFCLCNGQLERTSLKCPLMLQQRPLSGHSRKSHSGHYRKPDGLLHDLLQFSEQSFSPHSDRAYRNPP